MIYVFGVSDCAGRNIGQLSVNTDTDNNRGRSITTQEEAEAYLWYHGFVQSGNAIHLEKVLSVVTTSSTLGN